MRIRLNKCDALEDWFAIVRSEHDGREWMERIGPNSSRLMCSERLSPEACIEGSAAEMLAIAHAIKAERSEAFTRCAVRFENDGVHFWSPRNSRHDGVVTIDEANEFADQVLAELASSAKVSE